MTIRWRHAIRWGSILAGLLLLGLAARVLPLEEALFSLRGVLRSVGPWAPLVYGVAFVAGAVALLPVTALTMASGFLLGPAWGTVVASLASTTAAAISFQIGRGALRAGLERRLQRRPRLAALHAAVGSEGWRLIALLRLSPLVPFGLGNYFYGLTPVRFRHYVLASWAAMLPGTVLYCLLGAAGRSALSAQEQSPLEIAYLFVGLTATIVAVSWTTIVARRELRKRLARSELSGSRDPGCPSHLPIARSAHSSR